MRQIDVVLHSPEHPGNIGAIARAMHNLGFEQLILISPQTNHLDEEARRRAKHAIHILEKAIILPSEQELSYDIIIATSAKTITTSTHRKPITPKELRAELEQKTGTIAILMGRESSGLTNKELEIADILVTIPTKGALNISHATTILLYELSNLQPSKRQLATKKQQEQLTNNINTIIDRTDLPSTKKELQKTTWKKLFANNYLTGRQAQTIIGLLKKLL